MQISANACFDLFKRPRGIPIFVEMLGCSLRNENIARFDRWEQSATSPWPPHDELGWPWMEKIIMRRGGIRAAGG